MDSQLLKERTLPMWKCHLKRDYQPVIFYDLEISSVLCFLLTTMAMTFSCNLFHSVPINMIVVMVYCINILTNVSYYKLMFH